MRYDSKLKHPLWQKKRLEIMKRDSFMCQICGATCNELHVHHSFYDKAIKNPWDYPNDGLITLCDQCHNDNHNSLIGANALYFLTLFCKLINRPHTIVINIRREIEYKIKVIELTEKEAIKLTLLEYLKHS